jgi:hypothetical protein
VASQDARGQRERGPAKHQQQYQKRQVQQQQHHQQQQQHHDRNVYSRLGDRLERGERQEQGDEDETGKRVTKSPSSEAVTDQAGTDDKGPEEIGHEDQAETAANEGDDEQRAESPEEGEETVTTHGVDENGGGDGGADEDGGADHGGADHGGADNGDFNFEEAAGIDAFEFDNRPL